MDEYFDKRNEMMKEIADQIATTYAKKNKDYNNSFGRQFDKYGPISVLVRLGDKFGRIENLILQDRDPEVVDESLKDTLVDLAAYAMMTLIELEMNEK